MFAMTFVACGTAAAQTPSAGAALPAGVRTIPPERLANYWLLDADTAQADVPNSGRGLDAPTCAAVSYVIEKNGTTSHVKLEKVVPEGALGKVAFNIVRGMRFAAAAQNAGKTPVATWVVIPFNLPPAASKKPADLAARQRVLDACKMTAPAGSEAD
jgi:hypothetical protein